MKSDMYITWYVSCPVCPTKINTINSSFWHCKHIIIIIIIFNPMAENSLRLFEVMHMCFHLSRPYVCNWSIYINNPWANSLSQTSVADFWSMFLIYFFYIIFIFLPTKQFSTRWKQTNIFQFFPVPD